MVTCWLLLFFSTVYNIFQIEVLKELLRKQGKSYLLDWLQDILLDTCRVKVKDRGSAITVEDAVVMEPVPFHFNREWFGRMKYIMKCSCDNQNVL